MRLGATIKSVLAGLAMAVDEIHGNADSSGTTNPQIADVVQTLQQIFYICPRIDQIAHALLCGGIPCAQDRCSLAVGFPVHPMLANPSLEQVEQFVTAEGGRPMGPSRMEIPMDCGHRRTGTAAPPNYSVGICWIPRINIRMPSILSGLCSQVSESFMDAEIAGVVSTGESDTEFRLLPFQDLSTRRGTKQVDGRSVQIRIYAFDLLYLNGVSLIKQPLYERQRALRQQFKETAGFAFVSSITLARYDEALIQNFLKESVQGGAEGLMIKLTGREENVGSAGSRTFIMSLEAG
jgi:DNA ligase-1